MKRTLTPLLIVIVIACALTSAFAQDGAHTHAGIDDNAAAIAGHETRLDGHDAAIEAVKNAGAAADAAQDARMDDLQAQIYALAGGSSGGGGTDPDPERKLLFVFVDIEAETKTIVTEAQLSLVDPPAFALCVVSSDPERPIAGRVGFVNDGAPKPQDEGRADYCAWGGDGFLEDKYVASPWGAGAHRSEAVERETGLTASLDVIISHSDPGGGGGGQHADLKPPVLPDTGGRPIMQAGLGIGQPVGYNDMAEPFLNRALAAGGWNGRRADNSEITFAELWAGGHIDPATLLPRSMPADAVRLEGPSIRFGARFYPEFYAEDMVLEWEGDADVRWGFGMFTQPSLSIPDPDNPRRIIGKFKPEDRGHMRVEVYALGEGGLTDLAIYPLADEAAWRAGKLLNPKFDAIACRYDVLRTMDWSYPMESGVRDPAQISPASSRHYGRAVKYDPAAPDMPLQMPVEVFAAVAAECDSALWYNVAGPIGAPEEIDQLSWGVQNPLPPDLGEQLRTLARNSGKLIIASDAWDRYADRLVAALGAVDYDPATLLIIEIGNELWNYAPPFWWQTNYYAGLGEGNGPIPGGMLNYSFGQGYAAARMAHAFHHALERAGRDQNWTMALGAQTAWDMTSRSALNAYGKYFRDRDIDPAPWYAKAGVVTTSYYANALGEKGILPKRADESHDEWAARWLEAIRADPDGMAQQATDWFFQDIDQDATFHWIKARRAQHRANAESVGAFLLGDYEGGSHESHGVIQKLRGEPDFIAWLADWRYGAHGERLTGAWIEEMYADDPDAIIANFALIGAVAPEARALNWPNNPERWIDAPWMDHFHDEENGFTRGIDPYLRPAN